MPWNWIEPLLEQCQLSFKLFIYFFNDLLATNCNCCLLFQACPLLGSLFLVITWISSIVFIFQSIDFPRLSALCPFTFPLLWLFRIFSSISFSSNLSRYIRIVFIRLLGSFDLGYISYCLCIFRLLIWAPLSFSFRLIFGMFFNCLFVLNFQFSLVDFFCFFRLFNHFFGLFDYLFAFFDFFELRNLIVTSKLFPYWCCLRLDILIRLLSTLLSIRW